VTPDDIDKAIADFLRRADSASERALAETGRAGLDRVLDLWYGRAARSTPDVVDGPHGQVAADAWSAMLSTVAYANPSAFVDSLAGQPVSTAILTILGDVDDPRATAILCAHVADDDWLRRYNAVASLARRDEQVARQCLERALDDQNLVVRSRAIAAVSRWDPARAIPLYEQLLVAKGLTPLLRVATESALRDLRAD
jgi:HEAT repeat protein